MSDALALMAGQPHADGSVSFGSDERLWVKFYPKPVHMAFKSEQEGRPIYESRDYIEIRQPGERDALIREVNEADKHRFARQWHAYQEGKEVTQDGTPLDTLYPREPHMVKMMQALHIHTVEQLAHLQEAGIGRLGMGGRAHVQRAQAFLEAAGRMAGANQMQAQLDAANDQIAELRNQIEQLRAAATEPRRGPGRPRKHAEAEAEIEE
jgi:hypothetical protein